MARQNTARQDIARQEPARRAVERDGPERRLSGEAATPGERPADPAQPSSTGSVAKGTIAKGTIAKGTPAQGSPAQGSPAADRGTTSDVYVPVIETARIVRGDSLWRISRRTYGEGERYTLIYDANQDQIRDPDLIYPGQVLVLPSPAAPAAGGTGKHD